MNARNVVLGKESEGAQQVQELREAQCGEGRAVRGAAGGSQILRRRMTQPEKPWSRLKQESSMVGRPALRSRLSKKKASERELGT